MARNQAFARLGIILGAFALPLGALFYFHFVSGSGSNSELAVAAVLSVVAAAIAASSVFRGQTQSDESQSVVEGLRLARPLLELKPDGSILSASRAVQNLLGYRPEQCIGRHHSMFFEAGVASSTEYRELWSRLVRGQGCEHSHKFKTESGGELAVLSSYVPVFDAQGKLSKVLSLLQDLSTVKAEDALVASMKDALKKLANGDLAARIELSQDDGLKQDFNAGMERMQQTLQAIADDVTSISHGSEEISQAADNYSRRTEQQAASLEQTAAALEEITATVKKTAANAREAHSSVKGANNAAEDGGRVVETAISAMDSISQSSKQITDIIGVIDEIAFQTNLLALNAGVEAARAGEAGKGFAVVASEVRALAQRSSEAAKKIKALIETSGEHVASGVKLVGETGKALKRIVDQVGQINGLIAEIALAAEQQSTGIEQVNAAVGQMDQVTQQNAAMAEQSTAASRRLAGDAQNLLQRMSIFRLDRTPKALSPKPSLSKVTRSATIVPLRRTPAKDGWADF